jgi:O-antigen/teichoic acid export membrane protein
VALRISTLTAFVLISINSVVAPEFARLYANGRHDELARLAQKSAFWTLSVALPPLLVMLIFPEMILAMFGEPFAAAGWPLRILAVGQLVNVATGQVASLLTMIGMRSCFAIPLPFRPSSTSRATFCSCLLSGRQGLR